MSELASQILRTFGYQVAHVQYVLLPLLPTCWQSHICGKRLSVFRSAGYQVSDDWVCLSLGVGRFFEWKTDPFRLSTLKHIYPHICPINQLTYPLVLLYNHGSQIYIIKEPWFFGGAGSSRENHRFLKALESAGSSNSLILESSRNPKIGTCWIFWIFFKGLETTDGSLLMDLLQRT
jgi:hypothetical protein